MSKMATLKIYFILFLLFTFASAGPGSNEEDYQFTGNVATTEKPAQDGSYLKMYQRSEYHNNGDPRPRLATAYKFQRCPAAGGGACKDIDLVEIALNDKNVVTNNTAPAEDGSFIQIYQKNVYHKDGSPVRRLTMYKRCTAAPPPENISCKEFQILDLVFED